MRASSASRTRLSVEPKRAMRSPCRLQTDALTPGGRFVGGELFRWRFLTGSEYIWDARYVKKKRDTDAPSGRPRNSPHESLLACLANPRPITASLTKVHGRAIRRAVCFESLPA